MGSLNHDIHVMFPYAPEQQKEHFRDCSQYLDWKFANTENHDITSFLFTIAPILFDPDDSYLKDCVGNNIPIIDPTGYDNPHQIDPYCNDIPVFRWKAGSITKAEGYEFFKGEQNNGITDTNRTKITQLTSRTRSVFSSCHNLSIVSASCDASRNCVSYSECPTSSSEYDITDRSSEQQGYMLRLPIFKPKDSARYIIINQRESGGESDPTFSFVPGAKPCCIPAFLPSSLQTCTRSGPSHPIFPDQYIRGDLGILLGTMMFSVNTHEKDDLNNKITHAGILERVFLQGKDERLPKWYKSVWTDMSVADGFCTTDIQNVRGYVVYFSEDPENIECGYSQVEKFFEDSESHDESVWKQTRPFIYMRRNGFQSHQEVEEPLEEILTPQFYLDDVEMK